MKLVILFSLLLLSLAAMGMQTAPTESAPLNFVILKFNWYDDTRRPEIETTPFSAADSSAAVTLPNNAEAKPPLKREDLRYGYSLKFRNTDARTISSLSWEYVFLDSGTGKAVGRHPFYSNVRVDSGKEKTVIATSTISPTKIISVGALGKEKPFTERVVINCITYSDGSNWTRPQFTGDCKASEQDKK